MVGALGDALPFADMVNFWYGVNPEMELADNTSKLNKLFVMDFVGFSGALFHEAPSYWLQTPRNTNLLLSDEHR
ncbi:Uncharacterised protein [Klebsiella pneumoniae]|nr:Uncharacterised protein [Klebsiella pneumoniae]